MKQDGHFPNVFDKIQIKSNAPILKQYFQTAIVECRRQDIQKNNAVRNSNKTAFVL